MKLLLREQFSFPKNIWFLNPNTLIPLYIYIYLLLHINIHSLCVQQKSTTSTNEYIKAVVTKHIHPHLNNNKALQVNSIKHTSRTLDRKNRKSCIKNADNATSAGHNRQLKLT